MTNPFSGQQVKNYLLLYAVVLVIIILFYFLNASLSTVKDQEKRVFETNSSLVPVEVAEESEEVLDENSSLDRIRLMDKAY